VKAFAALSLATVCLSTSTQAQTPILEAHFYGNSSSQFVNHDPATGCRVTNNCNVALDGTDALPILVNPWESVSINIVCTQIIFMPTGPLSPHAYLYAGNSFIAPSDIMAWGVPSPTGAADIDKCLPPGFAFPFPAKMAQAPSNRHGQNNFMEPHLDIHILGTPASVAYDVWLKVLYTKNPQ
jgi:hypothetical protein